MVAYNFIIPWILGYTRFISQSEYNYFIIKRVPRQQVLQTIVIVVNGNIQLEVILNQFCVFCVLHGFIKVALTLQMQVLNEIVLLAMKKNHK